VCAICDKGQTVGEYLAAHSAALVKEAAGKGRRVQKAGPVRPRSELTVRRRS
jgi:hypothetical protein